MNRLRHTLPLRVAIVSDAEPERNGVGTYYRDLCEHLSPCVDNVTLICPRRDDPTLNQWLKFPLPGDATQRIGVPSPLQLHRRLKALDPHAVIVATPGPYGVMGARFARRGAKHLVFGLHTHYEALSGLYWGTVLAGMNRWYLSTVNRRLACQADHVVANAPEMCELGRSLGARRVSMVGTLLPESFLTRPVEPLSNTLETVLFIGRLAAEKRVHTVLEAAAAMPGLKFRIAGDGPLRPAVEAAARQYANVEYLGWLRRDQVLRTLDGCDLLVMPSQVEAFGTVALESLARGRLTLVSPGCGIGQWAALSPSLYTMYEGESLTQAIRRVADDPPRVRQQRACDSRAAVAATVRGGLDAWLAVLTGNDQQHVLKAHIA